MVKGSGRKRRAVADAPVELDAEGGHLVHHALPCELQRGSCHQYDRAMALEDLHCAANLPGASADPDHGATQPAHRTSQPNPYFDEDDEELETYENEARACERSSRSACHALFLCCFAEQWMLSTQFRLYRTEANAAASESKTPLSATVSFQ
jgi:hypothetical protein